MEERIHVLEERYNEIRQSQDDLLIMNDSAHKKLDENMRKLDMIYDCLLGNEFEQEQGNGHGGGVMKRISKLEDRVDAISTWVANVKGRNRAVWSILALITGSILTLFIKAWDKIFN